jgi:prepilin-type N-terminal cleavage/methylation domain-containing protein
MIHPGAQAGTLATRTANRAAARGFTVIEMLIVVVILAILAGMAVPRLFTNDHRIFRLTCDEVADLLTMYAKRESTGSRPVGLMYDEQRHALVMLEFDVDDQSARGRARWRTDALIQPVRLPEFVELVEVRADGDYIDITEWPLSNRPGQERPRISLSLQGVGRTVTLVLPPHAVSPRQIGWSDDDAMHPVPVDLNSIGLSRGEW